MNSNRCPYYRRLGPPSEHVFDPDLGNRRNTHPAVQLNGGADPRTSAEAFQTAPLEDGVHARAGVLKRGGTFDTDTAWGSLFSRGFIDTVKVSDEHVVDVDSMDGALDRLVRRYPFLVDDSLIPDDEDGRSTPSTLRWQGSEGSRFDTRSGGLNDARKGFQCAARSSFGRHHLRGMSELDTETLVYRCAASNISTALAESCGSGEGPHFTSVRGNASRSKIA